MQNNIREIANTCKYLVTGICSFIISYSLYKFADAETLYVIRPQYHLDNEVI
jgi:hypothetical protein